MNFDGSWSGSGAVQAKGNNRRCALVEMQFTQTKESLEVKNLGWTCGDISKKWPEPIVFKIEKGHLLYNDIKVGEVSEFKIHLMAKTQNSQSNFYLLYHSKTHVTTYREVIRFANKQVWTVSGQMTKNKKGAF